MMYSLVLSVFHWVTWLWTVEWYTDSMIRQYRDLVCLTYAFHSASNVLHIASRIKW